MLSCNRLHYHGFEAYTIKVTSQKSKRSRPLSPALRAPFLLQHLDSTGTGPLWAGHRHLELGSVDGVLSAALRQLTRETCFAAWAMFMYEYYFYHFGTPILFGFQLVQLFAYVVSFPDKSGSLLFMPNNCYNFISNQQNVHVVLSITMWISFLWL